MANKRRMLTRWEMVDLVKICGESIENHAEEIIGNDKYFSDVTVTFKINRFDDEQTCININRNFFPEGVIEEEAKHETKRRNTKNTRNTGKKGGA